MFIHLFTPLHARGNLSQFRRKFEDFFVRLTFLKILIARKFYIPSIFLVSTNHSHPITFSYFSIKGLNRCKRLDYFLLPSNLTSSTSYYEIERRKWSLSDDRLDFMVQRICFAEFSPQDEITLRKRRKGPHRTKRQM